MEISLQLKQGYYCCGTSHSNTTMHIVHHDARSLQGEMTDKFFMTLFHTETAVEFRDESIKTEKKTNNGRKKQRQEAGEKKQ
jgi:hypothetical protein